MKRTWRVLLGIAFALAFAEMASAQLGMFSKQQRAEFTREWKGERFPDGRPKVPDELIARLSKVSAEEAWSVLRHHNFNNQFEGGWQVINGGEKRMAGRVVTAVFMPLRPDVNTVINDKRLKEIFQLLLDKNYVHEGQMRDVLNRGRDQARHILLDKRAELRRLLGRQRVNYDVTEIELIASFHFHRVDKPELLVDEELITRTVAQHLNLPFVHLDPLSLDYKLVTESFGGPFAERHLVVAVEDTSDQLTLAIVDPWDRELLESIARYKAKNIKPVLATKSEILHIIVEFHGFRRSMRAAEAEFGSDLPDLGNLEQLYRLKGLNELDATDPAKPYTPGPGTFYTAMIEQAGGANVGAELDSEWAQVSLEFLLVRDPQYILLGDAMWGVTPESIAERPGWDALTAVKEERVLPFDDNLIARIGPRQVDGLEALAQILHPEAFK